MNKNTLENTMFLSESQLTGAETPNHEIKSYYYFLNSPNKTLQILFSMTYVFNSQYIMA